MKQWLTPLVSLMQRHPNPSLRLEEREADSCLGYGFYWLESDGSKDFRWSRRFFGFLVKDEQLREIALELSSHLELTISIAVDESPAETRVLKVGGQIVTVRPPRGVVEGTKHIAFRLERNFEFSGDSRKVGVQLLALRITTEREVIRYPASVFSHNAAKESWQRCHRHFELRGSPAGLALRNTQLNVEERTCEAETLKSTPLRLYLEVAWLCHLRCPSCFHAYVKPAWRKQATHFMSPFVFRKVAEQLFPGAMMVWYNGNGETLLHPNAEAILQTAREYAFIPALLTSGSLFTERNMRILVEGGFFLSVSVDSPVARDFERLRAGACYDKLVAALEHLRELNRSIRNPRFNLRLQCVAQQSNLHQLADLVQWANQFGACEVQFLPLQNFGQLSDHIEQAKLHHTPDYANRQMLAAIRAGSGLGIRVRPFPPFNLGSSVNREFVAALQENVQASSRVDDFYRPLMRLAEHPSNNPGRECFLAWSECFIGIDGGVAPCDMYLDVTTAGNLHDDDFWDIWNGPQMARMRRTVNHQPDGLCRFGTCMFRNSNPVRAPSQAHSS